MRVEVTREKFVEMTQDLLDRTRFTTRQTLQAAGLEWGADRPRAAGRRLEPHADGSRHAAAAFRQGAGWRSSPDEAVAHGAALHAGLLLAKQPGKAAAFRIRNVNSHSLGVVATDPKTGRKRTAVLIPRNTPLPVTAKRVFRTQQTGQPSMLVQIVEGESPSPDDCTPIGKCIIDRLPPNLPAQTPVLVRFHYAANGRLDISVKVGENGQEVKQEISRINGLSPEHLEAWRAWVMKGVGGH